MRHVDERTFAIAAEQHQLVTRDQFLRFGSRHQLDRRLASGALVRVYESVYRLAGTTPSWRQNLLAACLAGGRPSAAAFRAAAQLMQLPGGTEVVEITCPRHRRTYYEGVIAHESRFLTEDDLLVIDGIPVTRAARTICDFAGLVALRTLNRSTAEHALLEAVRRGLVDIASVWREHDRLGGTFRLGGEVMYKMLNEFVPPMRPTESPVETRVLQMLRENGLPEPVPQFCLVLLDGERIRLDFAWPELRTSLEWDPYKYHGDRERYEHMAPRTRKMRAMKWERVCVTDDDLDAGMPESLAALRMILAERQPVRL